MSTKEDATNQQQVSMSLKSHTMNAELHLGTELHSDAKFQNEVEAHSNYEISIHERDVELPKKDAHSDSEVERPTKETRAEPRLSKYVKRHHLSTQIIGDKYVGLMIRNKLRNDTYLLSIKEHKLVRDTLEDLD